MSEFYSSGGANNSTGRDVFEDSEARNLTGQNQYNNQNQGTGLTGGNSQSTFGTGSSGFGSHNHQGTAFTQGCDECNRSGNHHNNDGKPGLLDKLTGKSKHSHEGTNYTQGCEECSRTDRHHGDNNEKPGLLDKLTGKNKHSHEGTNYTQGCDECGRSQSSTHGNHGSTGLTGNHGNTGLTGTGAGIGSGIGSHNHQGTSYTQGCEECGRSQSSTHGNYGTTGAVGTGIGSHNHQGTSYTEGCNECSRTGRHGSNNNDGKPGLVDKLMGKGKHSHEGTNYTSGCEECDRPSHSKTDNQYQTPRESGVGGGLTGGHSTGGYSGLDTAEERSKYSHLNTDADRAGPGRSEGGYATGGTTNNQGNSALSSGAAGTDRFGGNDTTTGRSSYGENIGDKEADNHRVGRHGDDFTGGFAATGGAYQNPHATTGLTGRETTTTGVNDQHGDATQKQSIGTKIKNAIGMHNNDDVANSGSHHNDNRNL